MFKINLKLAWRNLVKDKQFTLLNVLGLSAGLACALLIFLWVNVESNYDKFFANDDQLYKLFEQRSNGSGDISYSEESSGKLSDAVKQSVSGVEYAAAYMPDASEFINRLLLRGNTRAEFITSKQPGVRSNGYRNATSLSIVDAIDCIQWIKKELHVFSPNNPMAFYAPYRFDIPNGWHIERSLFPPPFAPGIKLKGIEEIRFPPGWGIASSNEYWSMAYLFWLDKNQTINEDVLKEMLITYFDGLVITGGGSVPHNIPKDKQISTKVIIQKIKPESDDIETYSGTIHMLDYMAMKPMTLNFMVHVKSCDDKNHFPVFAEASIKPFSDPLWNDLKSMKQHFVCGE